MVTGKIIRAQQRAIESLKGELLKLCSHGELRIPIYIPRGSDAEGYKYDEFWGDGIIYEDMLLDKPSCCIECYTGDEYLFNYEITWAQLLNAGETTNPLTGLKHIQLTNS